MYRHSRTANREWTRGAEKCPLLILDEATSALASEVEAAIQDQLVGLIEGKTVIAIARQLSLNPGRHAERRRLGVPPLTVPAWNTLIAGFEQQNAFVALLRLLPLSECTVRGAVQQPVFCQSVHFFSLPSAFRHAATPLMEVHASDAIFEG
jgi:hypothetical protein